MITYLNCKKTLGWLLATLQYIREGEKYIPVSPDCMLELFKIFKVNVPYPLGEFHLSLTHQSLQIEDVTDCIKYNAVINEKDYCAYTKILLYGDLKSNKYVWEIIITDEKDYVINKLNSENLKSVYFETMYSRMYNCYQLYDFLSKGGDKKLSEINLLKKEVLQLEKDCNDNQLQPAHSIITEMNKFINEYVKGNIFKSDVFSLIQETLICRMLYPTV